MVFIIFLNDKKFVPYHKMEFQKFKHAVTRYFETKSTEQNLTITQQPSRFIQMQICFFDEKKKGTLQ